MRYLHEFLSSRPMPFMEWRYRVWIALVALFLIVLAA